MQQKMFYVILQNILFTYLPYKIYNNTIVAAQEKQTANRKATEKTRQRKVLKRCTLQSATTSEYLGTLFIDMDGKLKTFVNIKNILW